MRRAALVRRRGRFGPGFALLRLVGALELDQVVEREHQRDESRRPTVANVTRTRPEGAYASGSLNLPWLDRLDVESSGVGSPLIKTAIGVAPAHLRQRSPGVLQCEERQRSAAAREGRRTRNA